MAEKQNTFNEAGLDGLLLGAVSIVYLLLTHFMNQLTMAPFLAGTISVVLWVGKLSVCIVLLRCFMGKHLSQVGDEPSPFAFGCLVSALSALVYAAFYFVYAKFIAPDMFTDAFAAMMESYSSMLDSQALEQIQNLEPSMPTISFFATLFWCSLLGVVFSAVLSRNMISSNPFDEDNNQPEEQ